MSLRLIKLVLLVTGSLLPAIASETTKTALSADAALRRLIEGNKHFLSERPSHAIRNRRRREEIKHAQHPFAIILSCSDSRVPPEIIFDQGMGELFVVRVAGNVASEEVLASIEYAAAHPHAPLVVGMGHERCGAVAATLSGGAAEGHLGALTKAIQPAVDAVKGKPGDSLDNAVRANVNLVVKQLVASEEMLGKLIKE